MGAIIVDEKLFRLFIKWYDDNIGLVKPESAMIADRVNFFNDARDLLGYISVYKTDTYYIKEDYYNLLINGREEK